ncbi:MAG TPA: LysM peptidoglycan-binding domain-containing protein [Chthoniobacterales bacterium]|nr:LysM peptidoglycan-binding domain-containing protein [Chthoniobacterales bacterium]
MKWLFVLFLAIIIFGGAAWFGYNFVFKEDIQVAKEQRGEVTPEPRIDLTLPEYEAAAKLRQDGKIPEARAALTTFIQKYPTSPHADEAKDLLGEVNVDIFLSRTPSPEKEEYIVKPGDVLAKVARKVKSTPELIMRMNNLNGTMLHIGERLLISHPDFAIVVQRKPKLLVLLNHGGFFKQYHIQEEKLPASTSSKVTARVTEVMAWRDGKRVGFGTKEFIGSTRWIRLSSQAYTIYSVSDAAHPNLGQPPPPQGIGLVAADVEELSSLVNNKTPVTITD